MAKVVLRIRTNDGVDVFSGFQTETEPNNISQSISDWSLVTENNGTNGKSLAKPLSLSDGFLGTAKTKLQSEQDKYNGFMFGATDDSGNYSLELTIQGSAIDKIIIVGDIEANQFPIEAIVDRGTDKQRAIYSDDPTWAIAFEEESDSHTIEFTKWNRANYNACFTTINVLSKFLELNKAWINSLDYTLDVQSSGAIPSTGNAEINDIDGELYDLLKDKIISSENLDSELHFNGKLFQNVSINDVDYSLANRTVNFSLSNVLNNMRESRLPGKKSENTVLIPRSPETYMTLKDELYSGIEYDLSKTVFANNEELTIDEYLENIHIPVYLLEPEETQLERINSICEVAQLFMFLDKNDKLKAFSSTPHLGSEERAIIIPKNYQINDLSISEFGKDYYNKVKIPEISWTKNKKKFGTSHTVTFQKVESDDDEGVSTYKEVYNTQENAFAGNTEIVEITSPPGPDGLTTTSKYYKTHIAFDFPEVILPYNFQLDLYLYIENEDKGLKFKGTQFFNSGTTTNTNIVDISVDAEENGYIKNLTYTGKRHIEFDYYVYKEYVPTTDDVFVNLNITPTIKSTIQLYGEVYSQETTDLEFYNEELNKYNIYEFSQNKFLTSKTTYKNEKISKIIANKILNSYKSSVPTGSISIFCQNYYYRNGEIAKNFKNGEMFEPGELICFEQFPNRIFRITSCVPKYNGDFIVDLIFQEVKIEINRTYTTSSGWEYQYDGANWWLVGVPDGSGVLTIPNTIDTEHGTINIYGIKSLTDTAINNALKYSTVIIENGIKEIGNKALRNMDITSITIPSTVIKIDELAFAGCIYLTEMTFLSTTPPLITENVSIHSATKTIYVPLQSVSNYKNANVWVNYKDIIYPNVPETEGLVYTGLDGYGEVITDEKWIASYVVGDYSLSNSNGYTGTETKVYIPRYHNGKPVTQITAMAFGGANIEEILIPSTITNIGSLGLSVATNLKKIYIFAKTPPELVSINAIRVDLDNSIIYVPAESLEAYKTHQIWGFFANLMQPI